jgi:hypothetical protein
MIQAYFCLDQDGRCGSDFNVATASGSSERSDTVAAIGFSMKAGSE